MPIAHHGDVAIHYDSYGDVDAPAVLLMAGAGRPATDFDAPFIDGLTAAGFRVMRLDSRDTGLSTAFPGVSANLCAVYHAARGGAPANPPYAIADMAADAIAVLDAAGVDRAHIVGRSLGGMVAQHLAIHAPARVASLALVMANSRSLIDRIGEATLDQLEAESIPDADAYVARQLRVFQANGIAEDFDADRIAAEARIAWARGVHPGATARHFAAALAAEDMRPALAGVAAPTLVIHGARDPVIPPAYAVETAGAIPCAELVMIEEMAHDAPPHLRADWLRRIVRHVTTLDAGTPSHM
ncbi:hypothetical protein HMP09_2694 [Sphingomonas sp. HMP9]|nr:hypothetical protein HMP09_2694 [Sphingomonas sp. HMP9]